MIIFKDCKLYFIMLLSIYSMSKGASGSRPSPGGAANSPPNGMQIREGPDRATVNWEPATNDVDGYVVNMGTEANPTQFTQRVPSSDRRRFRQDGLEPETDYQVSIKSFDSEGESEPIQQGFRTRPSEYSNIDMCIILVYI